MEKSLMGRVGYQDIEESVMMDRQSGHEGVSDDG